MPQITVDYSGRLADGFDRPAFARDLHTAVVEIAAAKQPACKTRFRRTEDIVVGQDTDGHAHVHVHIAMLPGRTDDTKARLTETVLELLRTYVRPAGGLTLHASAEVRELDASYRKSEGE
ncbi:MULTISPECIES: 5-carboxymethyl-2-hydroxymuconate Delta-isomerase [Streptomyces]|uniref:5-carboxymethyl-2-hydroxymuconate Delta-isomerase n=1 Tax=Streptomyces edwardsiae TaxID=3075527 RepID=A0ABU2QN09_9ACTN|nr:MULTISPECIES: 5-carboxymethyl-2-hydroxymuconate Delta-isomerase [unclassified Streptomyces]MDT0405852.1 5-carboxymethyl-2-hydroxymuconate Delta-isomerase [Streptomyces sp. DSM 41635]